MDDDPRSPTAVDADLESRRKKRWSDFTPQQQRAIILGAIVEVVMTTIALSDLARRPADQVRGRKIAWLIAFTVQPFGPMLYLVGGRRRPR